MDAPNYRQDDRFLEICFYANILVVGDILTTILENHWLLRIICLFESVSKYE